VYAHAHTKLTPPLPSPTSRSSPIIVDRHNNMTTACSTQHPRWLPTPQRRVNAHQAHRRVDERTVLQRMACSNLIPEIIASIHTTTRSTNDAPRPASHVCEETCRHCRTRPSSANRWPSHHWLATPRHHRQASSGEGSQNLNFGAVNFHTLTHSSDSSSSLLSKKKCRCHPVCLVCSVVTPLVLA
jgi:hypothetical protein